MHTTVSVNYIGVVFVSEEAVQRYIRLLPKTDGTALDIGANHGWYTIPMADKFGKVYAFEPDEENANIIAQLIVNKPNVELIRKAVSNKTGTTQLYLSIDSPTGHTINTDLVDLKYYGHLPELFVVVECITLDDFCKGKKIDFIKCDIETGEDFIFDTAIRTLQNNKLDIILEVHVLTNRERLFSLFQSLGYTIYDDNKRLVDHFDQDQHYLITNK